LRLQKSGISTIVAARFLRRSYENTVYRGQLEDA
jgi:hypothetical protein